MKKFSLVAACCRSNGIGKNGDLPWRLRNEMNFFTRITSTVLDKNSSDSSESSTPKKNAVIMGMTTYMCIPPKYRPLAGRINVVLSRKAEQVPEGANFMYRSLTEAVKELSKMPEIDQLFIIGGASVYAEAIESQHCEFVFLTRIDADFDCDRFFPKVDLELYADLPEGSEPMARYSVPTGVQTEKGINYQYHLYQRKDTC